MLGRKRCGIPKQLFRQVQTIYKSPIRLVPHEVADHPLVILQRDELPRELRGVRLVFRAVDVREIAINRR
ncbi:hypothetical protein D3C81_1874340 [compost metagenome]